MHFLKNFHIIYNKIKNLTEQYIQSPLNNNNYNNMRQPTPNQRPLTEQSSIRTNNNNNIPPSISSTIIFKI